MGIDLDLDGQRGCQDDTIVFSLPSGPGARTALNPAE